MSDSQVTTLIVTYNSAAVIRDLLDDLRRIDLGGPIIIIDNASTDQTVDILRHQYPEVHLVQNIQNLGYGKAVNQGFKMCHLPYVFLLNPDIRIPGPDLISKMVNWMDSSPRIGATGPLQFSIGERGYYLKFISSYLGWRAYPNYLYYRIQHRWRSPNPIRVPMLNAGCIMIRRSAFIQVGGLDPRHFLYGEEPDLGTKFNRFGYESWLLPEISIIHIREKSLQTLPVRQQRRIHKQAIWNICDAFLAGWWRIILDKITRNQINPS